MSRSSEGPFPHGEVIGGFRDVQTPTGLVRLNWDAQLLWHENIWWAVMLDDADQHTEVRATGDTARLAFEHLVTRWTLLNDGMVSPFMQYILPSARAELDAAGVV